jgi:hypothetical protein
MYAGMASLKWFSDIDLIQYLVRSRGSYYVYHDTRLPSTLNTRLLSEKGKSHALYICMNATAKLTKSNVEKLCSYWSTGTFARGITELV